LKAFTVPLDDLLARDPSEPGSLKPATLVHRPDPFGARIERREIREGLTLAEILAEIEPDPILRAHLVVSIGGHEIRPDLLTQIRPKPGALVNAWLRPAGGDSGSKILRTVLQIAVIAAAAWIGFGAGGLISSKLLAATAAATVSVVGNLAINALVPPPQPGFGDREGSFSATYFPETARNQAAYFEPVRVPFGEHRFFPTLHGLPIQEAVGDQLYLRYLLSLGPMPLEFDPSTLQIGETPLSAFEGVEWEARVQPDDPPLTLYVNDPFQDSVGALLSGPGSWTSRTTQSDVTEIGVVVGFRSGLGRKDDRGRNQNVSVGVEVRYRRTGTTEPYTYVRAGTANTANQAVAAAGADRLNYFDMVETLQDFATAAAGQGGTTAPRVWTRREPGKLFRDTIRFFVPAAQYDVEVRRTTAPSSDEMTFDDVHFELLESVSPRDNNPLAWHAVMALRIKGSDQLSGSIDTLNLVARRRGPALDPDAVAGSDPDVSGLTPAAWSGERHSRNCADMALFVLKGAMTPRPARDDQISWPSLAAFWVWCRDHDYSFDFILDRAMRRDDMMAMIAAAGRARALKIEGVWHWIIDGPRPAGPVQIFTGRNVRNFRVAKTWPAEVHALRCTFLNRENGWRQDERIVYLPGWSANGDEPGTSKAENFELLELPGVTDPDIIIRLALFHAATALSQTENYTWDIPDAEGLTALLGDLVALQHDVLVTGIVSGRVTARTLSGGQVTAVEIDEAAEIPPGASYGALWRSVPGADGDPGRIIIRDPVPIQPGPAEGETALIVFSSGVPVADAPQIGDIVTVGETGKEYLQGLLKTTRGLDDWGAACSAVAYAPNRFEASEGSFPPFDPKVSYDPNRRPPAPVLTGIAITEDGIAIEFSLSGRIRQLARFDLAWRYTPEDGGEASWNPRPPLGPAERVALFPAGLPGESFDFSISAVDLDGRAGEPLIVTGLGPDDAVAAPTGVTAEGVLSGAPGEARLPKLRVACDPIERPDRDVITVEARPASGTDDAWRGRDVLDPASPEKDIPDVTPGELIDVGFRVRSRRGVFSPRVVVEGVQIPSELVASSSIDSEDIRQIAERAQEDIDAAKDRLSANKERIADAVEAVTGGIRPGAHTLEDAARSSMRILAQEGAQNFFLDPTGERGKRDWRSADAMPVMIDLDGGGRAVRVETTAAAADEILSLVSAARWPLSVEPRLMAAVYVSWTGVAVEPRLGFAFYGPDGAMLDDVIEVDDDLGNGRIGGFVEPEEIPAGAVEFELIVSVRASGAGAMRLQIERWSASFAGPNQDAVPPFAAPESEWAAWIGELVRAHTRGAVRQSELRYQTADALSRVLTLEEVGEGFAQRIGVVEAELVTPGTGVLARLTSAEIALIDLDGSKASVSSVLALDLRLGGAEGEIGQLFDIAADLQAGKANVTALTALDLRLGGAEGEIGQLFDIAADLQAGKANVTALTALGLQVDGLDAEINQLFSITASLDGSKADLTAVQNLALTVDGQGQTLSGLSSDVASISGDVNDLMSARLIQQSAGAAWAGLGIFARQSNGQAASQIRMGAQEFWYGLSFANADRRLVLDFLAGFERAYGPGQQLLREFNFNTGLQRWWRTDGVLMMDNVTGINMAALPPALVPQFASASGSNLFEGNWVTLTTATITGAVNSGRLTITSNLEIQTPPGLDIVGSDGQWRFVLFQSGQTDITAAIGQWSTRGPSGQTWPFMASLQKIVEMPWGGNVGCRIQVRRTGGDMGTSGTADLTLRREG
jgi:hypothetical protein